MGRTTLGGKQIKDESIKSVDIASGSIKAGELSPEAISGHTTITDVSSTEDYLLVWDASDSTLKKAVPSNLGVSSGGGSSSDTFLPANATYSLVTNLLGSGTPAMGSYQSFTAGIKFMPLRPRTITGARLWNNLVSDTTFKISLWDDDQSRLASISQTISSGDGMYTISFSSPYTITNDQVGNIMHITFYHETGMSYPKTISNGVVPATPFVADPHYVIVGYNSYGTGDSFPGSSASEYYMIEPIFSTS